jgi:hypothetical protein
MKKYEAVMVLAALKTRLREDDSFRKGLPGLSAAIDIALRAITNSAWMEDQEEWGPKPWEGAI